MNRRTLLKALLGVPLIGMPAVKALAALGPRNNDALLVLLEERMARAGARLRREIEQSLYQEAPLYHWWRTGTGAEHVPLDEDTQRRLLYEWRQCSASVTIRRADQD